ncbi:hypothetical protein BDV33DRAFT_206850 [Aspergillus novoparasiticus]|uniref:NAD(P)-binding protein n=1 Tax=Aspergillus novoparasiticus TaxID=986946 RepID=A0A5N6EJJ2_9EURO|nr:hypothetical protein BDV33DRAFT_206850 [Aspergillus novoparasiticus]
MALEKDVVVVTGCGGMGIAIARRVGSGSLITLADHSQTMLERAVHALHEEGHNMEGVQTDVTDLSAVEKLALHAAGLGWIRVVVHTADVAMNQAAPSRVYHVNLLGTANVIEASAPLWASKGARINSVNPGVVLSNMMKEELEGPAASMLRKSIDRTPAGRMETTADIANVVAFLWSTDAIFVTGSDLLVDGGLTGLNLWGNGGFGLVF